MRSSQSDRFEPVVELLSIKRIQHFASLSPLADGGVHPHGTIDPVVASTRWRRIIRPPARDAELERRALSPFQQRLITPGIASNAHCHPWIEMFRSVSRRGAGSETKCYRGLGPLLAIAQARPSVASAVGSGRPGGGDESYAGGLDCGSAGGRGSRGAWTGHAVRQSGKCARLGHSTGGACSRREVGLLASKPGNPIKRYASGKLLSVGVEALLAAGLRKGNQGSVVPFQPSVHLLKGIRRFDSVERESGEAGEHSERIKEKYRTHGRRRGCAPLYVTSWTAKAGQ